MAEEKVKRYIENESVSDGSAYCKNFHAHRPGITAAENTEVYDRWAAGYEQDLNRERYRGPIIAAEIVAEFFPANQRHEVLVLDVAAGSGFVGEELRKLSFTRIHALDPSSGMLEEARKKGVYKRFYCCYLNDQRLPIEDNFYDCAVTSGGMGEGHIPTAGLFELARIVKPGGLVSIVMREEFLEHVAEYRGRLERVMQTMEDDKLWRLHSRTVVPRFFFDKSGVIFQFIVC